MSRRPLAALARLALLVSVCAVWTSPLRGDEGMWTFHHPPLAQLKGKYGVELDQAWMDRLRLASVRFNSGGSGSFVSADGLVLTNHHVALESIHKLSSPEHDYVKDGFHAESREAELACPDLELNVLQAMSDVTARVQAAAEGVPPADAEKARRAAIGQIEQEARDASGLRSNVVSLYQGGEYWLYQYRQFTDVRLVFAPESQAAFFGGDPDNFTYPRYALDFALMRAYVDGKPYRPEHWLTIDPAGPKEGELVFVSGHPGNTQRLLTFAQLAYQRDHALPRSLATLRAVRDALKAYAATSPEAERQAQDSLMGIENSLKANGGAYEGLLDEALMARKKEEEDRLRAAIAKRPELAAEVGAAFDEIAAARAAVLPLAERLAYGRFAGDVAGLAHTLVRWAAESQKPNAERQAPYRDSSADSLKLRLFSTAPLYPALEEALLAAQLVLAQQHLAEDDPLKTALLAGQTPEEAARALATGTKLYDPEVRRALFQGGPEAIAASDDPLLQRVRVLDPILRELEEQVETKISAIESLAQARIARARFAAFGRELAPDATFTLRLSFGQVLGYEEDTTMVPWKTTFYGLYDRAFSFDQKPPYDLSPRFAERREKLDLATPYNFVSTCDIIGGNSGSPTVNAEGRLVGLIFDGNIQSLPNRFIYADQADRALSVHSAAILAALEHVYDAPELAAELKGS